MYRLFAALPIPPEYIPDLAVLQKNVTGASWRPHENFHITLCFYGEVDRRLAEALDGELETIQCEQFQIELQGVGWFGRRAPHALWARVKPSEGVSRLAGACTRAGKRLGLRIEKRPYVPHITLAYCHGTPLEAVENYYARHRGFETAPFWADRFHLYSSHMGKGPSRYVAEADYPLA